MSPLEEIIQPVGHAPYCRCQICLVLPSRTDASRVALYKASGGSERKE